MRTSHITCQAQAFTGRFFPEGVAGDCYELRAEFDNLQSPLSVILRSNGKDQYTLLHVDPQQNIITLDRNHSGKGSGGIRQCEIAPFEVLSLVIYMDRSSLEIFINQGEAVFSARIFPDPSATAIYFESESPCRLLSLDYFSLKRDGIVQ